MTAPDWTDPLGPCPFPSGTPPRVPWAPSGMSPDRLEFWGAVAASRCWCMPCPSCGEDWCALLPDGSPDGYRLAAEIGCSASCEPPAMAWWHAWRNGDPGLVFLDRINAANPTPAIG